MHTVQLNITQASMRNVDNCHTKIEIIRYILFWAIRENATPFLYEENAFPNNSVKAN